ncbi:transposase [Parendozoicomonas sp. Alg238-R29]|uniref:transposase n=1 Tax=Parendozoicomonas sp. Alg238-R29 TaxID=2993446 RepID=UPI00248D67D5|nr:transposase [Parendozoicomonas sp. Alg238-R29]
MTRARRSLIDAQTTPYYHCMARCVRRAYLWGEDHLTGTNYEHRKAWVVDRLEELASVFAIEVCAYAVMSNHYHVVLYVDQQVCENWSDRDVLERWTQLFSGPLLVQRFLAGSALDKASQNRVSQFAEEYRNRLQDISWFMRCLNEHLARKANEEDGCKGRFWEGRFKSQALLDDAALLSCMAYVDLNPVRAGMASKPENSDYTSLQLRIRQWQTSRETQQRCQPLQVKPLGVQGQSKVRAIPFSLVDYMELVDWSGRAIRDDKRGAILSGSPSILIRLGIDADEWVKVLSPGGHHFTHAVGKVNALKSYAETLGQRWVQGVRASQRLFPAR